MEKYLWQTEKIWVNFEKSSKFKKNCGKFYKTSVINFEKIVNFEKICGSFGKICGNFEKSIMVN